MSFRTRLFIAFLLVVTLGVLLPAGLYQWLHLREFAQEMKVDARFAAAVAADVLQHEAAGTDADGVRRRMDDFARASHLYVRGVNASGELWLEATAGTVASSGGAGDGLRGRLDALLQQPASVRAFQDTGVLQQGDAAFARVALDLTPQDPAVPAAGWLLVGMVHPEARARLDSILLIMGCAAVSAGILALGFRMAMVRWLCGRLEETAAVARAIGAGDLKRRAPRYDSKELDDLAMAVNRMADGIAAQIRTITEQKTQLETVLNSMREGVLVIDKKCRITAVNRAMRDIFPDAEQAVGRSPLEVILSPELQQACEETVACTAGRQASRSFQIEPMRDKVYDVTMTRLRSVDDASGEDCLGAVAVFHDISPLTRLERVRRDFVANVSHELRTPLTSIKGYAETLLLGMEEEGGNGQGDMPAQGGAASARKNFLEIILKHANHMTKMVNDLLHLARLESGERQFEFRMVNAAEAFSQAYKECLHLAETSGLAVRNLLPAEGVAVHADQTRLVQVFRNLLENAFKYGAPSVLDAGSPGSPGLPGKPGATGEGPRGEVCVYCQERGGDVVFSIKDQGPGIPRADRERVFERFYRVEKHRQKHKAGSSGLGLAIVRHIVEKSRGAIWVESPVEDGHGTIFSFTLPKAPPAHDE
ncbi:ATP-binding protein [Megalodesulfovibrio gigas]|nr:ATP-binding protein [Megalodesulfovibrio gigas]